MFGTGNLPESRIMSGSEWAVGALLALSRLRQRCGAPVGVNSVSKRGCSRSTICYGRTWQSASGTGCRGILSSRDDFTESISLGRQRLHPVCRSLTRPETRHDLMECGIWLPPIQTASRRGPMGLPRVCRVNWRAYRRGEKRRNPSAKQQFHHGMAGTFSLGDL